MSKLKYKRIVLHPTEWDVDVFVSKDYKRIAEKLIDIYGNTFEHWENELTETGAPFVTMWKDKKNCNHIVCALQDLEPYVVAHEAVHITWYLDRQVNYRYRFNNQEVQAYLVDYLVREILAIK